MDIFININCSPADKEEWKVVGFYLEFPEQCPFLSDISFVESEDRVEEPDHEGEDHEDEAGDGEDDQKGLDHPGEVEHQEDLVLIRSSGIPLSHVVIKVRMILKNVHFPLIQSQGLHKTDWVFDESCKVDESPIEL